MNYKSAVVSLEEKVQTNPAPTLIKLTNHFHFHKDENFIPVNLSEIARTMRQRWEAYHVSNGTWYDYSDDGSSYSDDEEWEEEIEEEWE